MKTLLVVLVIRVLCLGNSFTCDALEQEFIPMCQEAGVEVEVHNLYRGGCSLKRHAKYLMCDTMAYSHRVYTNEVPYEEQGKISLRQALQLGQFDYISLQQVSHDSGVRDSFEPWLSMLMDTIKAYQPQAQLCWMQTWAYSADAPHKHFPRYDRNQQLMYDSIVACMEYVMSKKTYPLLLIPCGTAIQLGRSTSLGDTFCRDGFHLNRTYGRYTAAAVWYEIITGRNVNCLRYKNAKMTIKQRELTQKAAHKAVRKAKNAVF